MREWERRRERAQADEPYPVDLPDVLHQSHPCAPNTLGLFATEAIAAGSVLGAYVGQVTLKSCDQDDSSGGSSSGSEETGTETGHESCADTDSGDASGDESEGDEGGGEVEARACDGGKGKESETWVVGGGRRGGGLVRAARAAHPLSLSRLPRVHRGRVDSRKKEKVRCNCSRAELSAME